MSYININEIEAGMVTAGEVKDIRGRVILGKGQTISEKHLRIFKMWGVSEANIEGVNKEDITKRTTEKIEPERHNALSEELERNFKHTDASSMVIKELRRLALIRSIRMEIDANAD